MLIDSPNGQVRAARELRPSARSGQVAPGMSAMRAKLGERRPKLTPAPGGAHSWSDARQRRLEACVAGYLRGLRTART